MITAFTKIKSITLVTLFILSAAFTAQAQDDTREIGNKLRSGSSNSSFDLVKGNQIGIKMSAGRKPVQLLKLNFDVESLNHDSLKFKVNVYEFNHVAPAKNMVQQDILGAVPNGKHRITVNLEPYNIVAKGDILVAIEWLQTYHGDNHFAIGLFNGGTYRYEDGEWKKTPVAGVDFNVLVRKIK